MRRWGLGTRDLNKVSANQSSKVEKNKTTDSEEKLLSRYAKTRTRNQGSQQSQRKLIWQS